MSIGGRNSLPCKLAPLLVNINNMHSVGFPDGSGGKESACNAGDPSSIPGSGRSSGEGIGYPVQYSWASLVAQLVKNQPAMWETWVRSLGWEDPLEESMTTHSSILPGESPWTEKPGGLQPMGLQSSPCSLFISLPSGLLDFVVQ